ncbi:uncharacterized protein BDR25DRAFT_394316 [Lindgomyces ingoldianus]|uniref:Uncharacterized protein n=1 Tax=Lindgomyces ingoldianus TaxID=673940 RepID=A0ACB6QRP0_9PLEO|nr:uncharacterized protein BDR25DRAFT_394316 [Lindgomyces ingoldianus]KAF2469238.1 hypothetical protein BDR25DRAFT_394316 [Lindgomyces ingoldianus]
MADAIKKLKPSKLDAVVSWPMHRLQVLYPNPDEPSKPSNKFAFEYVSSDTNQSQALRQLLVNNRAYHAIMATLGKGFSDLDATVKGTHRGPRATQTSETNKPLHSFGSTTKLIPVKGQSLPLQQGAIITSFFCDQGDERRRSLRVLLKIVIQQVIDVSQNLAVYLLTDSKKGGKAATQELDIESLSKVPTLWDALQAMARDLPSGWLYIVVYGLERLSKESMAKFFELLKSLNSGDDASDDAPIKWLFLSRSGHPEIEKALRSKALEINIDDSENAAHLSDALRADISARINELGLPAPLDYFSKRQIHSRAEYNSIYVSLVIQELKNVQETGMTSTEIRALLESFPYGLTEMFEHIRKRLTRKVLQPGSGGIDYTKEILCYLILALRAPAMRELAIMADLPAEDRDDLERLKGYIRQCGAFVTLRGSELNENNAVQCVGFAAKEHLEKFAKNDLALDLADMQKRNHCASRAKEEEREEEEVRSEAGDQEVLPVDTDAPPQNEPLSPLPPPSEAPSGTTQDRDEPRDESSSLPPDRDQPPDENPVLSPKDALQYPIHYWIEHAKRAPEDVIEEFCTSHRQSTQYGESQGSQNSLGYQPYSTPNSSYGSGFKGQ